MRVFDSAMRLARVRCSGRGGCGLRELGIGYRARLELRVGLRKVPEVFARPDFISVLSGERVVFSRVGDWLPAET